MTDRPIPPSATLYDAVRTIEASPRRIAVVVDQAQQVIGTLTDGDVRRWLLKGGSLEAAVRGAMNPRPVMAPVGSADSHILELLRRANIMALPLVDSTGRYVRVVHLTELSVEDEVIGAADGFAAAVIMAGGEGMRLRPLTESIPKPMVEIGGIPLLERQVRRLAKAGVERIFLSVNYLSHVIEDHFGGGAAFGLRIEYLREKDKLGTAGALSLLPDCPQGPLIVMNGDILTTSDFANLYQYHVTHEAQVTVSAIDYRVEIPYGVIRSEGARVAALEEKPSQRFLCNAGIYAVAPQALELVPSRFYNMTDLIRDCLAQERPVAVFPVHEYWSDIGTPADLEDARRTFKKLAGQHD